MNQEKLLENIKLIEDNFPVNEYKSDTVHIWPLVRFLILMRFKNAFTQPANKPLNTEKLSGQKSSLIGFYIGIRHYFRFRKTLQHLRDKLKPAEVLLFSRSVEYTDIVDSNKYNRLIDPYIDYFKKNNIPAVKMEIGISEAVPRVHQTLMIDDTDFGVFYRAIRPSLKLTKDIKPLLDQVEKHTGVKLNTEEVLYAAGRCFYYRELFNLLLKKSKPKAVFLSAYYAFDTFGLILACRDLKIPTVDIQHGKQGKFHFMYSHWTKIPEGGYGLLPDYFWNWGKESEHNITRWMPRDSFHKAITGGNLWLMRWLSNKEQDKAIHAEYFNRIKNYKYIVLFSLQPIGSANFPPFILDAIKETAEDCLWLMRLHPRMNLNEIPELKNIIDSNSNTEMELSTSLPLFRLLEVATVQVTCWSSVAFEALTFNLPTILIHPEAKSLYNEQIESGIFMYSEDLETFKSQLYGKKSEVSSDYIIKDLAAVNNAMNKILKPQL